MKNLSLLARQAMRAGVQIHQQLSAATLHDPLARLPVGYWTDLQRALAHYRLAQSRSWQAASSVVLSDAKFLLRWLVNDLKALLSDLPQEVSSSSLAPASAIAADLVALAGEFDSVAIDLKAKTVAVTTEPVVLEGMDLGRFRIVLFWERLGSDGAYEIEALEPNPAADQDDVFHPHVKGKWLCEGAGMHPIRQALPSGRILDFFLVVRQILQTYNGGSAHVPLDEWFGEAGSTCEDCGYDTSDDESFYCERCQRSVCGECSSSCRECGRSVCGNCQAKCEACQAVCCGHCLEQRRCTSCREAANPSPDQPALMETPDDHDCQSEGSGGAQSPAADGVCLGEAALSA